MAEGDQPALKGATKTSLIPGHEVVGRVVERGTKEELFNAPMHPYTRALLDSIPPLTGEKPRRLKAQLCEMHVVDNKGIQRRVGTLAPYLKKNS